MNHRRGSRSGFTLIELLVVIAIIAILIGLLLPAVQKVREAAARTQCQNNLKQLGLALQSYHDVNLVLPPGIARNLPAEQTSPATFWSYFILPYIEQSAVYNLASVVAAPNWADAGNFQKAAETQIKTFRCPSSTDALTYSSQGITKRFAISYAANQSGTVGNPASPSGKLEWGAHLDDQTATGRGYNGWPLPTAPAYRFEGALGWNTVYPLVAITDGTSNTVGIGERFRYVSAANVDSYTTADRYGTFAMGSPNTNNANEQVVGSIGIPFNFNQSQQLTGDQNFNNAATCFSSRHTAGVNFVFLDGSVRLLSVSTSDLVRLALGTIAGGEVFDLP